MSKKVSVILLETVNGLGQAGDIVAVSEGHARNFLFPEGKAALATTAVQAQKQAEKDKQQRDKAIATATAQELAQSLEGTELTLKAKVKDGNEIFGKITKKHITDELNKQAKLKFTSKQIELPTAITTTGSQDVTINLTDDIATTIRVTVEADLPDRQAGQLARDEE